MAALVQTYPQQTSTVTVVQSRPNSNMMQTQNQQYMAAQQGQRNAAGATMHRNTAPIQPYAFTSTPNLNTSVPIQPYGAYRTTSSPAVPSAQMNQHPPLQDPRTRSSAHSPMNSMSYNPSVGVSQHGSRDDSAIHQSRNMQTVPRPQSAYMTGAPMPMTFAQAAAMKPAPDRYRRSAAHQPRQQGPAVTTNTMPVIGSRGPMVANRPNSYFDDTQVGRQPTNEDAQRMRRRSMNALDSAHSDDYARQQNAYHDPGQKSLRLVPPQDNAAHTRSGSSGSVSSSRSSHSRPSSSNRNASNPTVAAPSSSATVSDDGSVKQDSSKSVSVPPRSSSTDAAKRAINPSPLSRPATMADSAAQKANAASGDANLSSPAAQQLAALNQKGGKSKSKTSRLRRAFSFGSAADFNKAAEKPAEESVAAGTNAAANDKNAPARLHKEPTADELYDAEQEAIARKQEASGLGNSIYGGRFFHGSTDNISVSSTASSASIMIRKMGKGMKKGGRNLVGLFRPKSVVGVAPADGPVVTDGSQAAVSMVTAEAERVNVNGNPNGQSGGGTGFPHLERNSIDASQAPTMVSERSGSSGTDQSIRKSIVGGDRERAEVLAAVRKGILKHSASPSPSQERVPSFTLPAIPQVSDSPNSSTPSTPTEEIHGHKRTGSVAIGGEDYFVSALKLRQDTKSAPTTPSGSKRNATFSPRLIFHDTWPSQEYDRRGDIATCNRLTPMLAQQIKEELNTFKMEMEVHENSKIYTHFF